MRLEMKSRMEDRGLRFSILDPLIATGVME
jgi:hypothetical protein